MNRYAKPETVDEALTLLGQGPWKILAGGTDFYPALGNRPLRGNVLDINGLHELRGIAHTESHFVVGANTTWTDLVHHPLPPAFDALKQAGRDVGSLQIQNTATIAGNLCNASPAADGVPALMVLDAEIELRSSGSVRHLGLGSFILGNRHTAIRPGEMVTAIRIPQGSATGTSSFIKLGARRYLVISIAMAAARVAVGDDGTIENAAVAVGACSEVALRLHALELKLRGRPADASIGDCVDATHLAELAPISDVRADLSYRQEAAREIVARTLVAAVADRQMHGAAA